MRIEIALEARLTGVSWFLFFFLQKANVNEAVSGLRISFSTFFGWNDSR